MNVTIISPTTLQLSWSPLRTQQIVNTWGLQVNYQVNDNKTHSILVNKHRAKVNISQLRPDTTYTIWAIPVTSKGFGFSSQVLNVTTPYRGNFIFFFWLFRKIGRLPKVCTKVSKIFLSLNSERRVQNLRTLLHLIWRFLVPLWFHVLLKLPPFLKTFLRNLRFGMQVYNI